jgi:hypothetical protein
MIVHLALLAGAMLFLPIVPREALKPVGESQPVLGILILLGATIGLPYAALAATGPLLQAWFARAHPDRSPYRLYALSNLGSLLALLGYPFLMEPLLARRMQAYAWSGGFVVFALLCAGCAIAQRGSAVSAPAAKSIRTERRTLAQPQAASSDRNRWLWVILPMCGSIMLLAATSQLSEEIAPMPFIWVLPLATYLITFIIAFEWPRLYDRRVFAPLAIAAPWLYLALMLDERAGLGTQTAMYLAAVFACCMVCHGETYRLRPPPQRLTGYYLAISLGGALGGVFVSVIAPLIFVSNMEIYIGIFGSIALLLVCLLRDSASPFFRGANRPAWLGYIIIVLLAALLIRLSVSERMNNTTLQMRNFFGTLRVRFFEDRALPWAYNKLEHGRICHGAQAIDPAMRHHPLMYYSPDSGVGTAMRVYPKKTNRRVGVVGLGTGAMAAWGQKGDVYRFYEINPQVEQIAHNPFTYLDDSPAKVDVVLGDARLSMEREEPQRYDILVLDAFSGDAVPTHLLTREAFAVYRRHLVEGGVIAVNVTNRYLDLDPVVRRVAQEFGMSTVFITGVAQELPQSTISLWVLATDNAAMLQEKEITDAGVWPPGNEQSSLWTDDYCSILTSLRK